MTVEELSDKLKHMPPQAEVWMKYDGGYGSASVDVVVADGEKSVSLWDSEDVPYKNRDISVKTGDAE